MTRVFVALFAFVFSSIVTEAALPSPVLRWSMDSVDANGRIPDASGGGNALELGPNATLRHERFFNANVLVCDGTTNCWARSTKNVAVGSRTVSAWLYRTAGTEDKNVYVLNGLSGMGINCPNGGIGLKTLVDNTLLIDGAASLGTWNHIVWTIDITSTSGDKSYVTHKIFRNGEFYKSTSDFELTTSRFDGLSHLVILANDQVHGTRALRGALCDFRVYDQALTDAQAKQLYYESMHERTTRAVGFYRMEGSAEDAAGEGPSLTLGSGVAYAAGGLSGQALDYLDSREAYARVTNDTPPFADLSLALWMRPAPGMPPSEEINNKLVHLFTFQSGGKEYYRVNLVDMEDNGLRRFSVSDMATVDDGSAEGYKTEAGSFSEKGLWSHFAFVAKSQFDEEAGEWYVTPKYYLNGELITTGRRTTCTAFKTGGLYPKDIQLVLGNRGYPNNRAFWGQLDDVALISGALTDDQVRELYHGVPEIDAGRDFTVTSASARLAGSLSVVHTGDEGRAVAASTTAWSLVSAPAGGESASIESTDNLQTRVNLPVAGAYTFRLTVTSGPISIHDDVVVTRAAASENTPPSVTAKASGNAYVGIPLALEATATDDDGPGAVRVGWQCVSGADAVLFDPPVGTNVTAVFYAAGNYVLRAIADDGAAKATNEFAVTVAAATGDLSDGLLSHLQFDTVSLTATSGEADTPWSKYYDRVNVRLAPGVSGYGFHVVNPFTYSLVMLRNGTAWTLSEWDKNGSDNSNLTPTNDYRVFSCWLKYDAQCDTNSAYHSVIVEQPYGLGLLYDRESGKDVLRMHQVNGGATGDGFDVYSLDDADMSKAWIHVYALFDRVHAYASNVSELWINGVRQTPKQKCMGYGRPRNNVLEIGGLKCDQSATSGFSGHWTNEVGKTLSRTFPGYIDEFRMYARKLNEAEIKMLAMHPAPDVNRPPAVSAATGDCVVKSHSAKTVEALAADDGRPTDSTLTYEWKVLSGNASKLVFSDKNAKSTSVTAMKAGTYILALRVTDGARVTYSPPFVFEAKAIGTLVVFR